MLDNFFRGEVPSIFETTIKREKGRSDVLLRFLLLVWHGDSYHWANITRVSGHRVNAMSWVFFSQALSALFGSCVGRRQVSSFMIYLILSSRLNFSKHEKMNFRCSQDKCMPGNCLLQLNRCLVEIRSVSYVLMFN